MAPAKVSRTLKRMMRQTGLEDSDEEEEEESDGEEVRNNKNLVGWRIPDEAVARLCFEGLFL